MDEKQKKELIEALQAGLKEDAEDKGEMPEAGGICFTTLYSRTGTPYNVTARARTTWDALLEVVHTVQLAGLVLDMQTSKPEPPAAQPPKEPADQRIAKEAGNAPLAEALKAQSEAIPDPPPGKVWLTLDCKIVKVLPQPDDRVTIEFYADGHEYADIKANKWTLPQAAGLLKYVTVERVDKAAEYTLPCRVYYTEGKEYTSTKTGNKGHYKDIGHVRPL